IIFLLAFSTAFLIASGTSVALPVPKPTLPCLLPTTTSAAKRKRRPPLTTLVTRLIATTSSSKTISSLLSVKFCAMIDSFPRILSRQLLLHQLMPLYVRGINNHRGQRQLL